MQATVRSVQEMRDFLALDPAAKAGRVAVLDDGLDLRAMAAAEWESAFLHDPARPPVTLRARNRLAPPLLGPVSLRLAEADRGTGAMTGGLRLDGLRFEAPESTFLPLGTLGFSTTVVLLDIPGKVAEGDRPTDIEVRRCQFVGDLPDSRDDAREAEARITGIDCNNALRLTVELCRFAAISNGVSYSGRQVTVRQNLFAGLWEDPMQGAMVDGPTVEGVNLGYDSHEFDICGNVVQWMASDKRRHGDMGGHYSNWRGAGPAWLRGVRIRRNVLCFGSTYGRRSLPTGFGQQYHPAPPAVLPVTSGVGHVISGSGAVEVPAPGSGAAEVALVLDPNGEGEAVTLQPAAGVSLTYEGAGVPDFTLDQPGMSVVLAANGSTTGWTVRPETVTTQVFFVQAVKFAGLERIVIERNVANAPGLKFAELPGAVRSRVRQNTAVPVFPGDETGNGLANTFADAAVPGAQMRIMTEAGEDVEVVGNVCGSILNKDDGGNVVVGVGPAAWAANYDGEPSGDGIRIVATSATHALTLLRPKPGSPVALAGAGALAADGSDAAEWEFARAIERRKWG